MDGSVEEAEVTRVLQHILKMDLRWLAKYTGLSVPFLLNSKREEIGTLFRSAVILARAKRRLREIERRIEDGTSGV